MLKILKLKILVFLLLLLIFLSCTFSENNDYSADTDGDGILDAYEVEGSTFLGVDYYAMGARLDQKDIFVHINYMEGWASDAGRKPHKASLQLLKDAFLAKGYYLHFDVGNLYHPESGISPSDFDLSDLDHEVPFYENIEVRKLVDSSKPIKSPTSTTRSFYDYKNNYFPSARLSVFHYVVMGNTIVYNGENKKIRGLAELPGNDSVVGLGSQGLSVTGSTALSNSTINQIAYTIMHELGHNLYLRHGGFENDNYKPNYVSAMNYFYDKGLPRPNEISSSNFPARYYKFLANNSIAVPSTYPKNPSDMVDGRTTSTFRLDFSSGNYPALNENALSESAGILSNLGSVDWNVNGTTDLGTVSYDINNDKTLSILRDYNDWGNLLLHYNGFINYSEYTLKEISHSQVVNDIFDMNSNSISNINLEFYLEKDVGDWVY